MTVSLQLMGVRPLADMDMPRRCYLMREIERRELYLGVNHMALAKL